MSDYWAEQEYTCAPTDPNPIDPEAHGNGAFLAPNTGAPMTTPPAIILSRIRRLTYNAEKQNKTIKPDQILAILEQRKA